MVIPCWTMHPDFGKSTVQFGDGYVGHVVPNSKFYENTTYNAKRYVQKFGIRRGCIICPDGRKYCFGRDPWDGEHLRLEYVAGRIGFCHRTLGNPL